MFCTLKHVLNMYILYVFSGDAVMYSFSQVDLILFKVNSSTVICWMSPFVILDVSGQIYCFYSIFDDKS